MAYKYKIVKVSPEVHKKLKILSAEKDVAIGAVIAELVLKDEKEK